jgi:hypothetical protein
MGTLLAIAALAGLRLLTPASALELLPNGGFEDGSTGWQSAFGNVSVICEEETAAEGRCSARLTAAVGSAVLQHKQVQVQPGGSYTLSGLTLKNDNRVGFVQLHLVWKDAAGDMIWSEQSPKATLNQDAFQQLSTGPVPAPPDAASAIVSIHLGAYTAGAQAYVDGVHLEGPAPSPTSTAIPSDTASPATVTSTPAGTPLATATAAASPPPTPTPSTTPAPPGIPDGYLLNQGFEETVGDGLLGWTKYGGILGQATDRRRSGNFSAAFFSDTESTKWVYQTVRVRTDKAYVFDGYVLLNDPAVERAYLRVSWYASDDGSGSAISVSDSVEQLGCCDPSFRYIKTEPLSPPPGTRVAKFRVMLAPHSAAAARIYLDDMDLRETTPIAPPTPAPTVDAGATTGEETHEVLSVATRAPSRRTAASTGNGRPLPLDKSLYPIKLNEVMYAIAESTGGCEWLELYNASDSPVQLEGWQIGDNHAVDALPPLSLPTRSFAVVAANEEGFRRAYPDFTGTIVFVGDGKIGNGLADGGDRLALQDEAGRLVDALSYADDSSVFSPPAPAVVAGHSFERSPAGADSDSADDFVDNPEPSPGRALDALRKVHSATAGMSLAPASFMSAPQPQDEEFEGGTPWLWAALGASLIIFCAGFGTAAALWRLKARRHPD